MAPKRKRSTASRPTANHPSTADDMRKHQVFTDWSTQRGVELDSRIKPAKLPGRGLGLTATKAIPKDTRILYVPEKAMFVPDHRVLKRYHLNEASPQTRLAFSALIKCHPKDSVFNPWRLTWPTIDDFKECMVLYWQRNPNRPLLQSLESSLSWQDVIPPTVRAPLDRQLADYQKDLETVKPILAEIGNSEEEFLYYWLIVNSRSFHWKPEKPANARGSMVMCPYIDYLNHRPTGNGCQVLQTGKGYEVITDRDYAPEEEILVTYGAHSNDKLLVHYGFVCTDDLNEDDSISIDHIVLPALSEETKSQLQSTGFLGGYVLSCKDGQVCFKTQVAIRAAWLTCNEWEYFVTNGEDLEKDASQEVTQFIASLLSRWAEDSKKMVLNLEQAFESLGEKKGVVGLLKKRWMQILDAIAKLPNENHS